MPRPGAPRADEIGAPGPGGAGGVARGLELGDPLGLDPEAGPRAVGKLRVVPAALARAEPTPLEERADDVAAVADDMNRPAMRIGLRAGREHVRRLGSLLDAAQPGDEREAPDALEHEPDPVRRPASRGAHQCRDRRLVRADLAQVDEAGHGAERSGQEGRARPRRADDEHEPVLAAPQPLAEVAKAALAENAAGGGGVEAGGLDRRSASRSRRRPAGRPSVSARPTCSRIVSSSRNDASTCSLASARAPSGLPAASAARIASCWRSFARYSVSIDSSPGAQTAGPENVRRALFATCSMYGQVGDPVDDVVEAVVCLHPFHGQRPPILPGLTGPQRARHSREALFGRRELLEAALGDPLGRDAGDEALQLRPQQEGLPHLRPGERPDAEPPVGLERDEPERREPPQRLANRGPADLVLGRDLLLSENGAGRELTGDDRLLERKRDLVGFGAGVHGAV